MRNLVNSNCMRKAPEKEGKLTDPKMAFIGHETHGSSYGTLRHETADESIDNK